MSAFLFQNARVVDPSQNMDAVCDLLCRDGKIAAVGQGLSADGVKRIDASGLILAPGLIDLHTHLRDPGFTEKEDILTGCAAAAAGGVTTLCAMPNTKPTCDTPETIAYILEKSKNAKARVLPVAAITKGLAGKELTDMPALKKAGACAFSDDGVPVATAALMAQAMCEASKLNVPIFAHTEDQTLSKGGKINEGKVSRELGVPGIPNAAEDVGTARELALLMTAPKNTRLHICHVSTAGSVALIADAKRRGLSVTAETGPHYFMLNDEMLRTKADQEAVLKALVDGTLDVIATDHAPHTPLEKSDFLNAPNGVIGMETSFSAAYTALVLTGLMTVSELIYRMSTLPAKILGCNLGTLRVGAPADLILIDEHETWVVDPEHLHGKSKNAVFKGRKLQSKVKMTVYNGEIVFEDEREINHGV